jgi:hypothetical protein
MEDEKQSITESENQVVEEPKSKKKERTELPEGFEFANGCKSCKNYKLLLDDGYFLPLNFQNNLCEPFDPVGPINKKIKDYFWVKHLKTGKIEIVDKKWFEENQKKWDLIHIKMTTCRYRRIYKHKVVDETTGKEFLKDYCAYWAKE